MTDASLVKRVESLDSKRRVDILDVGGGLFRFSLSRFVASQDEVDRLHHGEGYWTIESSSGLYASADEAEAGARAQTTWMQELLG
jgi:hypothetical protein